MTIDTLADIRRKISEEAAEWFLTLQEGSLPAAERKRFADWIRQSPIHIAELLRICSLNGQLSAFPDWSEFAPYADLPPQVLTFPEAAAASAMRRPRIRRGVLWWSGVAAAACAASLFFFVKSGQQDYSTPLGDRREVTLADGSVVTLAPDTSMTVQMNAKQRNIMLRHGEALFRVARIPTRPFIVRAGETRVRAVGTVFSVMRDSGVTVTVVEGRVAVTPRPLDRQDSDLALVQADVNLAANQRVSVSEAGAATEVQAIDAVAEVAWTTDLLRFEKQTVEEIAQRLNRYNSTKIHIVDAELAGRRISGTLRISDPDAFAAFVQAGSEATIERPNSTLIVLGASESGTVDAAR